MKVKITVFLILAILSLSGCQAGQATLPTDAIHFKPEYTPTVTVPPLPSPTTWATKTPRPTETPIPTPLACWQEGGLVVEAEIPSAYQPEPLAFLIYLPPCYTQQPERLYPAVYLIHGQSFTPQQWVRLGAAEIADRRIAAGEAPPFIMVMPLVSDWDEPSVFSFDRIVIEELLPYVEAEYRASPARNDRGVAGISRGASWALHIGLKYWEVFGALAGHSLPVFFDDSPMVPIWLDAIPPEQMPRIYVDYAESDQSSLRRSANWFLDQLDSRAIPYTFSTAPGMHNEAYWGQRMEEYMSFYLAGW